MFRKEFYFAIILLITFMISCTSNKLTLESITRESLPKIDISNCEIASIDSTLTISGQRLQTNSTIQSVHLALPKLIVNVRPVVDPGKNSQLMCFDLQNDSLLWAYNSNFYSGKFVSDNLMKKYYAIRKGFNDREVFLNLSTGAIDKELTEPYDYRVLDNRIVYTDLMKAEGRSSAGPMSATSPIKLPGTLSPRECSPNNPEEFRKSDPNYALVVRDLKTDSLLWTRKVHYNMWDSNYYFCENEKQMYLVSDGIEGINTETGAGWFISSQTVGKEGEATAAILNTASVALALLGGGNAGTAHPWNVHHLRSAPLSLDNKTYFAAKNNVFCIGADTGEIFWHKQLENAYGIVDLVNLDGQLLLLYKGYQFATRYTNAYSLLSKVTRSKTPTQAVLLDLNDGAIIKEYLLPETEFINDYAITAQYIYLLTPNYIYQFDKELNFRAEIKNTEFGTFSKILNFKNNLLIKSFTSLTKLDETNLEIVWKIDNDAIAGQILYDKKDSFVREISWSISKGKSSEDVFISKSYDYKYNDYYFNESCLWYETFNEVRCIDLISGNMQYIIPVNSKDKVTLTNDGFLQIQNENYFRYYELTNAM